VSDGLKFVIFNADDFGYSCGVNRGIAEAHERGVVTATTLVVNAPATREAVELSRRLPRLSVGLHVNFTNEAQRLFDLEDPAACRAELWRQYATFCDLMGRKPSHLDAHQHVHRHPVRLPLFEELADAEGLPLRDRAPVTFKGGFYGQWQPGVFDPARVSFEALERMLRLEIFEGIFEVSCHPGYFDAGLEAVYHREREPELRTLTDPRLPRLIEELGLRLISYVDLPAAVEELHARRPTALGRKAVLVPAHAPRFVIFNAEDFGTSRGINRGLAEAHERGVVSSAGLVVNGAATLEAIGMARRLPRLALGLEVNFTDEGQPRIDLEDPAACRAELWAQYRAFCDQVGRKPTHLNSHHHVHRHPVRRRLFEELADAEGLHLRERLPVTFKGGFYGQWEYGVFEPEKVSFAAIERILRHEIDGGIYELVCHPGYFDPDLEAVYHREREHELRTLTDPRLPALLHELGLRAISFADLPAAARELEAAVSGSSDAH
jgi:PTS system cellobiose-specific IIA component